ncbi:hypothetical protein Hesp01_18430 [Herbidospora sp. NBRC 101105]|nr:hypothetical protein Hesp01_18430 [Herbidospora sp. NBRC 101105]
MAAVNPARGRIASLGSGGKRFSRAIASPAPGAPSVSISPMTHPAMPPRSLLNWFPLEFGSVHARAAKISAG